MKLLIEREKKEVELFRQRFRENKMSKPAYEEKMQPERKNMRKK